MKLFLSTFQIRIISQKYINFLAVHCNIPTALFFCALIINVANANALDSHWGAPPSIKLGSERVGNQALLALAEMLTVFESGDVGSATKIEDGIEPSMVGRSQLLRAIQDAQVQQQSIRIHLSDINVSANVSANAKANTDTVIITCRWEKRYLAIAARAVQPPLQSTLQPAPQLVHPLVPYLIKGDATFIFQRTSKQWKLSGMTGANLFAGGL